MNKTQVRKRRIAGNRIGNASNYVFCAGEQLRFGMEEGHRKVRDRMEAIRQDLSAVQKRLSELLDEIDADLGEDGNPF